jgi:hypothetical protein
MSNFRFARISLMPAAIGLNAVPVLMAGVHAQAAAPPLPPRRNRPPGSVQAARSTAVKQLMT